MRAASIAHPLPLLSLPSQDPQQRSSSAPTPQGQKKVKRKDKQIVQEGNRFVMEVIPFPDKQPWLQVKSRRRKAGVETMIEPVVVSAAELPEEGEVLSLDRDADRIAALMAQKRKENELRQFRRRMATQQRVHRGEPDQDEKVIAASSDELKRKLELSAKGVFEDKAPDGKEPAPKSEPAPEFVAQGSQASASPVLHMAIQLDHIEPGTAANSEPAQSRRTSLVEELVVREASRSDKVHEDASGVEEEVNPIEPVQVQAAPDAVMADTIAPQAFLHYNHTAYYQSMVTTQLAMASSEAIYAGPVQATQHTQSNMTSLQSVMHPHQQYASGWLATQPPVQQPWTQQMFQALPSTRTPVLEHSHLEDEGEYESPTTDEDSGLPYNTSTPERRLIPQNPMPNLFGPSPQHGSRHGSSSPDDGPHSHSNLSGLTNVFNNMESNLHPARFEPQPPVLHSNMNMFTRLARENGVIGGNNNLAATAAARRNMFDNSR